MKNFSLLELYKLRRKLREKGDHENLEKIQEEINYKEKSLFEDTSATGGPAVSGSGPFVNSQPSSLAGTTVGPNWINNGGTEGDGVSVPYNPSGVNRVFQKVEMGSNHGPRTGKKSRQKRISMKSIKDIFSKRQDFMVSQDKAETGKRVMNFDDYLKKDFNVIKK